MNFLNIRFVVDERILLRWVAGTVENNAGDIAFSKSMQLPSSSNNLALACLTHKMLPHILLSLRTDALSMQHHTISRFGNFFHTPVWRLDRPGYCPDLWNTSSGCAKKSRRPMTWA